jgi:hypothetical protein
LSCRWWDLLEIQLEFGGFRRVTRKYRPGRFACGLLDLARRRLGNTLDLGPNLNLVSLFRQSLPGV